MFGVEVGVVFGMGHFSGLLIVLGGVMPAVLHVHCTMQNDLTDVVLYTKPLY